MARGSSKGRTTGRGIALALLVSAALVGGGFLPAVAQETTAGVVHEGDNDSETSQSSSSRAGDAQAGGQTTGVVNNGGNVSINAENNSEDAEAESGEATSNNGVGVTHTGPVVLGTPATGAGEPAGEGDVGAAAIEADVINAGIVHDGDNEAEFDQASSAATGDAVAGGQVTGVVNNGGDVALALTNNSEDDEATSGNADADNAFGAGLVGPILATGALGGSVDPAAIEAGTINAGIVHEGDNEGEFNQDNSAASGDALAGAQVTGITNQDGNVDMVAENNSEGAESTSGDAGGANVGGLGLVGPVVADGLGGLGGGLGVVFPTAIEADVLNAGIVHDGDNESSFDQSGDAASGDAVSGGQIFGIVNDGGDVAVDNVNNSEDDQSTSGNSDSTNVTPLLLTGPFFV